MVRKTNHQFVADNAWHPCPRFLPSSSRRYMALASEPERISLFWRVTGSCVALLLCLPAVFLITFLALWLTLPPLPSFSEMFRAVSSWTSMLAALEALSTAVSVHFPLNVQSAPLEALAKIFWHLMPSMSVLAPLLELTEILSAVIFSMSASAPDELVKVSLSHLRWSMSVSAPLLSVMEQEVHLMPLNSASAPLLISRENGRLTFRSFCSWSDAPELRATCCGEAAARYTLMQLSLILTFLVNERFSVPFSILASKYGASVSSMTALTSVFSEASVV